ncbi:MAG: hypothetical protein Q8K93_02640 [Reyranella sp.]|nr:hypothetical protein [Reyranella sp.]
MLRFQTRGEFLRAAGATLAASLAASRTSAQSRRDVELVEITDSETATIDGRHWDKAFVGGRTVDAVHRSVLLRFPGAADAFAAALSQGRVLARAELAFTYDGYEIVPKGYLCREGLGRKLWTEDPPTWRIQAWPLRQPWIAGPTNGPTFNARVNGRRFWVRYGAGDPDRDRHGDLLVPQELSFRSREARIDITPLLATDILAKDAGARLLMLEQCGFLLRKVETYDSRYREQGNAYEWAMPTGGHGLRFTAPRLVLTCRRINGVVAITLPQRLDRTTLLRSGDGSRPTAVLPAPGDIAGLARRAIDAGLEGREPWQATRIRELQRVGGDKVSPWAEVEGEHSHKNYQARLREILATPPRYWQGWEIQDDLLVWHLFRDLLPAPVQDHMKAYWRAWLQPDLPTSAFVHPQSRDAIDYFKRNLDWRGRASFFRGGYNFAVSTQNFNHTAAMGALLGGAIIDAVNPMADGRHGLEFLPLRYWGFLDGSTQEMLDPYYLSITLSGLKMFADFAPEPIDRLMGRILVDRTLEMLASVYHPALRRFVASSGRARLSGVLVEQDGIYGALHTVSKAGVVNHLDKMPAETVHGMPAWGYDFPPGRVAMQSLRQPWAPAWMSGVIDGKPLPFEETAADTIRGNFKPPLWRRTYLGRWHGLASQDIHSGTIDLLGQWVRAPRTATRAEDRGMLTVRYVANAPDLTTTSGGVAIMAGLLLTFQSRNRAIVFAKPLGNRNRFLEAVGTGGLSRLATVIGLWNLANPRDWELFVDGRKIEAFPHRAKAGQSILIRDGISYLAILPLPATDLGRDAEIEIAPGIAGKAEPNGAAVAPALTLSLFNFKRDRPEPVSSFDFRTLATRTHGGFVLEMGDDAQHGSFEAFARHIQATRLTAAWHEDKHLLEVTYRSGPDLMEAGFTTDFSQRVTAHFPIDPGAQEKAIPWRRLNGQWPYLPAGIDRDSGIAQQGTTGRLEKNGAVLVTEPGRKAYLIADPLIGPGRGAVIAYNPLPDPQSWTLRTRDGITLQADGKVGLLRVEVRPWAREVDISHAPKPSQDGADMARTFTISGLAEAPRVTLNGHLATVRSVGQTFRISLG